MEKEQEADVPNHLKDGNRDKEGFGHGEGYLYPHAYRDHWVAQQYLPDALQGKMFYEPSDQGYERQIRDEVARKREAQLAAMLEAGDSRLEIGEIYTTSPKNKGKEAWLQRTISQAGQSLAQQRARLFDLAAVQRHHLVLDVNAGSGLLTWEAVRRAPEGGVYALAAATTDGEALRQQAERLPDLERPFILIGDLTELDTLLTLRGEDDLRFDRILARNLVTQLPNYPLNYRTLYPTQTTITARRPFLPRANHPPARPAAVPAGGLVRRDQDAGQQGSPGRRSHLRRHDRPTGELERNGPQSRAGSGGFYGRHRPAGPRKRKASGG